MALSEAVTLAPVGGLTVLAPSNPPNRVKHLRGTVGAAVRERGTPEGTRRATLFERHTVGRLDWRQLVRLNYWLQIGGKVTSGLWAGFIVAVVLGFDWKDTVESALNSGRPIRGAIVVVVVLPTLAFVAAHSAIGFARWRLQRELWRRDVQRLTAGPDER